MSPLALLLVAVTTAGICLPALLWILREARADRGSLIDDEDILY